jgi:hypothetical protein
MTESFVNNYVFTNKENKWNDGDSYKNQEYITGGLPINKILSYKRMTPHHHLANYVVPIGLVTFNNHFINKESYGGSDNDDDAMLTSHHVFENYTHGGSSESGELPTIIGGELAPEDLLNRLFKEVSVKQADVTIGGLNKTRKLKKQ